MGFELTTLVVIGTDCTGSCISNYHSSCISNYHTIMTTTAPVKRVRKYVYQVTIQSFISLQLKINLFFQFQEIFIYIYGSHLGEGTELLVLYIQFLLISVQFGLVVSDMMILMLFFYGFQYTFPNKCSVKNKGLVYGANATINNISVISWQSFLLVEETGVPRENHRPVAIH